ncbi:scavenger receptor cysteine-rich domain-containing group B protein-like [Aulostomus maculatus]
MVSSTSTLHPMMKVLQGTLVLLLIQSVTGSTDEAAAIAPPPPPPPTPTLMRLVNSDNSKCFGRVEVLHSNQWGTVCHDHWRLEDAEVVCQQLGCGKAVAAPREASFGEGSGPIWLDNVNCGGQEPSLFDCQHPGIGKHNCDHSEDASAICQGTDNTPTPNPPVRLVNSHNSRCFGRVEVFVGDRWGTVCDDGWSKRDAKVVCQQLGCGKAVSTPHSASFGEGSGPIWLDNVKCQGGESSLFDCSHKDFGRNNCDHSQDASVVCEGSL